MAIRNSVVQIQPLSVISQGDAAGRLVDAEQESLTLTSRNQLIPIYIPMHNTYLFIRSCACKSVMLIFLEDKLDMHLVSHISVKYMLNSF